MPSMTRRDLLEGSAAAVAVATMARSARARSANENVTVAVVGLRTRGTSLVQDLTQLDDVHVAALCDVDQAMFGPTLKVMQDRGRKPPPCETDVRRLIDRRDIDALVLATPDHWHAHPTIWACQAGQDVYVEKPVSHNLVEGRRMVEAARKHDRIVQVGTQRRSCPHWVEGIQRVQSGRLGKVSHVRTWLFNRIASIGRPADGPVPAGVDYDLWLGPAPRRPFNPARFHYNWHWFWDYGTGQLGNNGIHFLDLARWGLGLDYPSQVTSGGGMFCYDDAMESPDTQVVAFEFPEALVTWEHRIWSPQGFAGRRYGIEFLGDRAALLIDNLRWQIFEDDKLVEESSPSNTPTVPHLRDFVDCIRSRRRPAADIEEGHLSSVLCHIGNIAHRTGRRLRFDGETETFPDDPEANSLLSRAYASGWDLPNV